MGYKMSDRSVASLLKERDYTLQSRPSAQEGASRPLPGAQFEYINRETLAFQRRGLPVIFVEAKKKELSAESRHRGHRRRLLGKPGRVGAHDFEEKTASKGWASVDTDQDTAEFAVETIQRWWKNMGCRSYPAASEILILADPGDCDHDPVPAWRPEIRRFANQTGLTVSMCHFPAGTSKWNKIEHRMFSYTTQSRRGRPRVSHQVMVSLIGNPSTRSAPKITAPNNPTAHEVMSPRAMAETFESDRDWKYIISPGAAEHLA